MLTLVSCLELNTHDQIKLSTAQFMRVFYQNGDIRIRLRILIVKLYIMRWAYGETYTVDTQYSKIPDFQNRLLRKVDL